MKKTIMPIFFSCDDNYLPFLAVALYSLEKNASKRYQYNIHILHTNSVSKVNQKRIIKELCKEMFHIQFDDISHYVEQTKNKFHTRDYYTASTYYRLFIASLYPQYDKVLYLDSDIIIQGDISELLLKDINRNLLGGVIEDVMQNFDVFGNYVEQALGIDRNRYINAGILVINTKLFRKEKIEEKFYSLISSYTFYVTQDEDYLNVLCKDRIHYFRKAWNVTPIPHTEMSTNLIKIIHYKMSWKPWKYNDVMYGEIFWKYAYNVSYFRDLVVLSNSIDIEVAKRNDKIAFDNLCKRAIYDSEDPNNYNNQNKTNEDGVINEQVFNI